MNKYLKYKDLFQKIYTEEDIKIDEKMSEHIYFKVGGPADILVTPTDVEQLRKTLKICKENNIPYYIIGNGSNLLVKDGGIRGVVIKLVKLNKLERTENSIKAETGVLLKDVSNNALQGSLTGFEFACGIPGSVGGAVFMNAGAYNGEIRDVIKEAEVINNEGEIIVLSKEELELGYRTSKVMKEDFVVVSAVFELLYGDKEKIQARISCSYR